MALMADDGNWTDKVLGSWHCAGTKQIEKNYTDMCEARGTLCTPHTLQLHYASLLWPAPD